MATETNRLHIGLGARGPKTGLAPSGSVGEALLSNVSLALQTLEALTVHRETLGESETKALASTVSEVKRRLGRDGLFVCVVGEKKAGKSTFLNALLGERVLGTAVRECTGTVTFIRRASATNYRAHLTNGTDEDFSELFRQRETKLKSLGAEARRSYQAAQEMAASLPRRRQIAAEAVTQKRAAVAEARTDLGTSEAAAVAARQRLGDAEKALAAFELEVKAKGKKIPFGYRSLAQLVGILDLATAPGVPRISPTRVIDHAVLVREVRDERRRVLGLTSEAEEAGRHREAVRSRLSDRSAELEAATAHVRELERLAEGLPGETAQWRAEVARIEEEVARQPAERSKQFLEEVRKLTDMAARGGEVLRLDLEHPGRLLPGGLTIIDTPGVNTDNATNRERAWDVIRREADGCILLSDMQQAVSASTKEFVHEVREIVPHLILILTKVDRALDNAEAGDGLAKDQVDEARRHAERRFAQEVGRDRSEILSFAVSAERALAGDDAEHKRLFEEDVQRLFDVLSREKMVMLAARSARTISRCVAEINDAQRRAETSYRERIAALLEQRIPDPNKFYKEQMDRVESAIQSKARAAIRAAVAAFDRRMGELKERCSNEILACPDSATLKTYIDGVESILKDRFRALEKDVRQQIEKDAGSALRGIEKPLLEELRTRYQIAQRLAGGAGNRVGGQSVGVQSADVGGVAVDLLGSFGEFQSERGGRLAGGAAAGAVIGSFVMPVIGTFIGGAIGGAIGWMFGPSLDNVKGDCVRKLGLALEGTEAQVRPQLAGSTNQLAFSMREALGSILAGATRRYSGWIADLVREEEQRIAREKGKLQNLLEIRASLEQHDGQLTSLMRAAADETRGICR
jgi:hypothetical protein